MAVLINMAVLIMDSYIKLANLSDSVERESLLEEILTDLFEEHGWKVQRHNKTVDNSLLDLVINRHNISYAVQIKIASEGRADRLIPLWSQVYLQTKQTVRERQHPLVIIAAPRIPERAAKQLVEFTTRYAPEAAVGVIDFEGLRMFRGHHLEDLDANRSFHSPQIKQSRNTPQLFSDSYQWMFKVLLASELPETLLSAPRKTYQNASQLAESAGVSIMTAFRFIQQLQEQGYLHESDRYLKLVRRRELFKRWQNAAAVPAKEVPVRFIFKKDQKKEIKRILNKGSNCLGLFSAAETLRLGFVHGVPPYIYLPRLNDAAISELKNIVPTEPNESPDLILRQPCAPKSVFRGAVMTDGINVCDVLQVWIDVSAHPSRGKEQADFIERRILDSLILG
jgi:hypothetical protein